MKNALLLHGTDATPDSNWFESLKNLLEKRGYEVWVPQLPDAHQPDSRKYNDFLLKSDWEFNNDSLLVGHSSGAVEVLALLQALPPGTLIETAVLVGSFRGDLGWDSLKDLIKEPLDLDNVKTKAKKFIVIHSDNDPFCPLDDAKYYTEKLDAELIIVPGAEHFTPSLGGDKYKEGDFIISALGL